MLIDIKLKTGVTVGYHAITAVTDLGDAIKVEANYHGQYFTTIENKQDIAELVLTMEWTDNDCPHKTDDCLGMCDYCEHRAKEQHNEKRLCSN